MFTTALGLEELTAELAAPVMVLERTILFGLFSKRADHLLLFNSKHGFPLLRLLLPFFLVVSFHLAKEVLATPVSIVARPRVPIFEVFVADSAVIVFISILLMPFHVLDRLEEQVAVCESAFDLAWGRSHGDVSLSVVGGRWRYFVGDYLAKVGTPLREGVARQPR